MRRAVFLDRDGTIVEDTGYLHERERVKFFPEAGEAIQLLNKEGFKVIIVTNQAGVARGYYTEAAVRDLNRYIQELMAAQGALIDRFYYCPHHIDGVIEEYRRACNCRKPNTGMIEQAVRDFNINLADSFVIGDQASDIEAGRRAGCRTVLLGRCAEPGAAVNPVSPTHIAPDLYEAVKWLLKMAGESGPG